MPKRTFDGVAVHDVDVLDRHAQAVGDDLRERGLVSLAVRVRAGEHRHACRSDARALSPASNSPRARRGCRRHREGAMPQASM